VTKRENNNKKKRKKKKKNKYLCVDAVEQENQNALSWCHDIEDDKEEKLGSFTGNEHFDVTKDPRKSERNENGDVDSELLFTISLIRLGSTSQSLRNFTTDKEEKNGVDGNSHQTRDEKCTIGNPRIENVTPF